MTWNIRSDTATFVRWVRGLEWKTLRRKKRRFCASLLMFRRHFHIITIVSTCAFYSSLCMMVDEAKYFEISIFLHVLKCLMKMGVVKRLFSKFLLKLMSNIVIWGMTRPALWTAPLVSVGWGEGEGDAKTLFPRVSKWGEINHRPYVRAFCLS